MPVKWQGDEFLRKAETVVEQALDKLAHQHLEYARMRMRQGPHTGRDYRGWAFFIDPQGRLRAFKPKQKKGHQLRMRSSAPGEYPATQRGGAGLLGSLYWRRSGKFMREFGTNQKVGLYLEIGTKRMRPRPFLRMTYRHFIGKDTEVHFAGKL